MFFSDQSEKWVSEVLFVCWRNWNYFSKYAPINFKLQGFWVCACTHRSQRTVWRSWFSWTIKPKLSGWWQISFHQCQACSLSIIVSNCVIMEFWGHCCALTWLLHRVLIRGTLWCYCLCHKFGGFIPHTTYENCSNHVNILFKDRRACFLQEIEHINLFVTSLASCSSVI